MTGADVLYIGAFLAIPLILVVLLIGFDRVVSRITKPHYVWWGVALTQAVAMIARGGVERDFGVIFWLHAGAVVAAIAFAVNERARQRS